MTAHDSKPSLANALTALESADLTNTQKRDYRSAVMTFCKALGVEPSEVPASAASIRRKLAELSHLALGLSKGRWANIKTGLFKAISLVGTAYPSRNTTPLTAPWAALLEAVPQALKRKLSAGVRFLGTREVMPQDTTLADLHAYRDTILNDRLRANAEQAWDHFLWAWNRAVEQCAPTWPQVTIPRTVKREIYVYPLEFFPPVFADELAAYGRRLSNVDFDDDGPVRPARPATVKTRLYQLRAAASALVHAGVDPATITSLARLVEVEHFKQILHFFIERAGGKSTSNVAQIATCLRNAARYGVKVDDAHYAQLERIARKVAVPTGGMTVKNRERLRPFDDEALVREFVCLPDTMRSHVERDRRAPALKAVEAQMAAAIALVLAIPVRIGNLAAIDLHRHLVQQRKDVYLVIPEAETKNRQPINLKIPPYALEILRWYIREYRPLLIRQPTDALFPGRNGGHKSPHTLALQLKRVVFRFTGLAFNAHLFRHLAGKVFLDQQPGSYEVVRQVLGHKRIDTTTSFYAGAEVQRASKLFNALVDDLRAEHQPTGRRRRSA